MKESHLFVDHNLLKKRELYVPAENNLNRKVFGYKYEQMLYFIIASLTLYVVASYGIYGNSHSFDFLSLPTASSQHSSWTKDISLNTPRSEVAGVSLDGKIYIIGGLNVSGESTSTVEVYDIVAGKWSNAAPLPHPIDHAAVGSYDGRLYVAGGYSNGGVSDKLFIYDSLADSWTEGASMPGARGALTANFINGTLYAVGGADDSGASNTNQAYVPRTNKWIEKAPMPSAREHLSSAVVDGMLYVIGGRQTDSDSPKGNFDVNEMYNPQDDSWTIMEKMPTKRSGIAAATSSVAGKIYVFGGENPFKDEGTVMALDVVEKYNPITDDWTTEPPMPTPRHGLAAVAYDGNIYTIAGGNKPGLSVSNVNEVFLLSQK